MSKITDAGKIVDMFIRFSKNSEWEAIAKFFVILLSLLFFFGGVVLIWRHF